MEPKPIEPDSASEPLPKRPAGGHGNTVTITTAILILYIASIGPVAGFYQTHPAYSNSWHSDALRSFYTPLVYLCNGCMPVRDIFMAYSEACARVLYGAPAISMFKKISTSCGAPPPTAAVPAAPTPSPAPASTNISTSPQTAEK